MTDITVIPPSPDVSALLKHIDFPVSHYTGTPQISVPIYTIKMNSFSVPISLSYHASGIKVDETASWVGTGWSLNAGGVISRTVRGVPDEITGAALGFFGSQHLFKSDGTPDGNYLDTFDPSTHYGEPGILDSLNLNLLDAQADLFYYSFPGGSDKFAFNQDKTPVFYTPQDVIITEDPFNQTNDRWVFQDSKGIKYTFDKFETASTDNNCGVADDPYDQPISYKNSWHLTSIKNGSEYVNFTYVGENIEYDLEQSESKRFLINGVGTNSSTATCTYTTTVTKQRLSQITTSNGITIDFVAKTTDRDDLTGSHALDEIIVKQGGTAALNFALETSATGRLMLNEFFQFEAGNKSNKTNTYTFDYFSGGFPDPFSDSQDYWGYYNNANNTTRLPEFKTNLYHFNAGAGADRSPDLTYAKRGTLNKVTYPTGGYSEFTYELHDRYNADHKETFIYEASATGGTSTSGVKDSVSFTVAANCSATLTIVGIPQEDTGNVLNLAEIRSCNGSTCTEINLTANAGNRYTLPADDYELFVQNASEPTTSIKIEFEQVEAGNEPVGGLRVEKIRYYDPVEGSDIVKRYTYKSEQNPTQSSGFMFSDFVFHSVSTHEGGCGTNGGNFLNLTTSSNVPLTNIQSSHIGYSEVREYQVADDNTSLTDFSNILGYTYFSFINVDGSDISFPFLPQKDLSYKNGKVLLSKQYGVHNSAFAELASTTNYYSFSASDEFWNFKVKQSTTSSCGFTVYQLDHYTQSDYKMGTYWHKLDSTVEVRKANLTDLDELVTTTYYQYNDTTHHQLTNLITKYNSADSSETKYTRDHYVQARYWPGLVTVEERLRKDSIVSKQKTTYDDFLPEKISFWDFDSAAYVTKTEIDRDIYGNVLSVKDYPDQGGIVTEYTWAFDSDLPVIKVLNPETGFSTALTHAYSNAGTGSGYTSLQNLLDAVNMVAESTSQKSIWDDFNRLLRDHANSSSSQIFTYTYDDERRLSSVTDPAGQTQYFVYDAFGRLEKVKDLNHHLISEYMYNYASPSN